MSKHQSQLNSLLEATDALLQAHVLLKEEHRVVKERLEEALSALDELKSERTANNLHSTPTTEPSPLSAAELDALVEEIDSCIALLKT